MNKTSSRFSRQPLSRRRFLGTSALLGAGLTLSACETGLASFSKEPEPNEQLVRLAAAIKNSQRDPKWSKFLGKQYDLVQQEALRQCGVDKDGNTPQQCKEKFLNADNAQADQGISLKEAYERALDGDQKGLVAGLYAAYVAANQKMSQTNAHPPRVSKEIADGFSDAAAEFGTVLTLTYGAIFATGVALAKDATPDGSASIQKIANELRTLRDHCIDVLEELGAEVPAPEPGYTQGKADNMTAAAEYLYPTVLPISVQLRRISARATNPQAVEFATGWLKATACDEAALERLQGKDPRKITLRGEPA